MNFLNRHKQRNQVSSLEEAIGMCIAQHERGKELVYKYFYGYILGLTKRYVRNEFDAEELTNEVFIRAFAKVSTFKHTHTQVTREVSFKAWLSRIAVNISIDFLRAKKSALFVDDEDQLMSVAYGERSDSQLHVQDIMKMLRQLPDIQRVIFNLYEVEGYSHEEVGKLLDIPESTSRTYLTRAKQKLRTLYEAMLT